MRRIKDLPFGCIGHISPAYVEVNAADNTCYLWPDGILSENALQEDLTTYREVDGYVLSVPPGSVRFTPRHISWQERYSLIRVIRVEESPQTPSPGPLVPKQNDCHPLPRKEDATALPTPSEPYLPLHVEPSYQTVSLAKYSPEFVKLATKVFEHVAHQVGHARARRYKGSFSVRASSGPQTAAKVLIYESNLGTRCGNWPDLRDGVYVLIRVNGEIGDSIWVNLNKRPDLTRKIDRNNTIGVAPKHQERFAYFRVESECDLEEISALVAVC
jgi:hypothetical protein